MAIVFETAVATALLDAAADEFAALVDGADDPGYIRWLTAGDALLATSVLDDPSFAASADGEIEAAAIGNVTASGTGTVAKFEIYDGDDTLLATGSVSVTAGGGDAQFDVVAWIAGGTVAVSSFTLTITFAA